MTAVDQPEPADCCGCTPASPCDASCDGQLIDDGSALTHCTRCQRDLEQMIAGEEEEPDAPPPADQVDVIAERWAKTTAGPWRWWGNTDSGNLALAGHQPRLGVCEVLGTTPVERTMTDAGANAYREHLRDVTVLDRPGVSKARRSYTPEEIEQQVRSDYVEDAWGGTITDRHLALTDEHHIIRTVAEVAVYEVARAQGLPDDTPRSNPHVYRADIVDVRNPNGQALAAAWGDVHYLLAEVRRLRAELAARTEDPS